MSKDRYMKHVLKWLIAGSRGGPNRAKIIETLKDEPMNANKLTEVMDVDYRTVRHHLELLEKNGLITSMGPRYGRMYFISDILEQSYSDFEEIWKESGNKDNKGSEG